MASSSRIAPQESGKINASVSTVGRRGTFLKRISVYSNDPKRPRINLNMRIEVVTPESLQTP